MPTREAAALPISNTDAPAHVHCQPPTKLRRPLLPDFATDCQKTKFLKIPTIVQFFAHRSSFGPPFDSSLVPLDSSCHRDLFEVIV
ncbi:hypothetical protein PanWU01x14_240090 [Parasponia andersonii]|uniref:Uncharacterized protein n=1 Tax=Parasponia andersonii TaxID=3476 RepID=A0A2P5BGW7_PARAD|nr:hypothetical protein PanWU01x14_240090 [Parasponia andersonii]